MRIRVEQYGNKIGVDGNLKELIEDKKVSLLVSLLTEDNKHRTQFVLTGMEAKELVKSITDLLNDETTKKYGFTYA